MVNVMLNSVEREEMDRMRQRVAALEAVIAQPLKVEIEGLDGLKQWSAQIERDNDEMERRAAEPPSTQPRGMFENIAIWGWGITIIGGGLLYLSDWLFNWSGDF